MDLSKLSVRELRVIAVKQNCDTSKCIEKNDLVEEIKKAAKRKHRKSANPKRRKTDMKIWDGVLPIHITDFPDDINGKVIYVIKFDPNYQMKSTKDRRLWKT